MSAPTNRDAVIALLEATIEEVQADDDPFFDMDVGDAREFVYQAAAELLNSSRLTLNACRTILARLLGEAFSQSQD